MLARLHELRAAGETVALETTLATRHYLRFIAEARAQGYFVNLFFFWRWSNRWWQAYSSS